MNENSMNACAYPVQEQIACNGKDIDLGSLSERVRKIRNATEEALVISNEIKQVMYGPRGNPDKPANDDPCCMSEEIDMIGKTLNLVLNQLHDIRGWLC